MCFEINLNKSETNIFNKYKFQINKLFETNRNIDIESTAKFFHKKIINNVSSFIRNLKKIKYCEDIIFIKNIANIRFDNDADIFSAKVFSYALSLALGQPFQYQQQNNGEIIAEIKPMAEKENTHSSGGKIAFGWHTDDSFLISRFRTKWIQLMGVYNPDFISTKIASVDDIIEKLDQQSLSELLQRKYTIKISDSFGQFSQTYKKNISIIRINGDNKYEISVPTYNVKPSDDRDMSAHNAIRNLIKAANMSQKLICLEPGSILLFNNDRVLHAREAIKSDRLILRTYIRPNLRALQAMTESRHRVFDLAKLIEVA